MLKETETEETTVFFVTFLSLLAFQLGGGGGVGPHGYAYNPNCLTVASEKKRVVS